jgi:hypothetical protein
MGNTNDVSVQLRCDDLDDSRLQSITQELAKSLRQENIAEVNLTHTSPIPGTKGDPVTIGAIIMTLIGSHGLATKLIDVLRPYFARKPKMTLELTRPDGKKVSLSADSVSSGQLNQTNDILKSFFEN